MDKNKPWLDQYDPGVPATINYPKHCIHDLLALSAERFPYSIAIIDKDRSIDYLELDRLVTHFSQNLILHGMNSGDRVGICLPNSIEFIVAYFGILRAGGIVTALNPAFPGGELESQVRKAGIRFMINYDSSLMGFLPSLNTTSLEMIISVHSETKKPLSKSVIPKPEQVCDYSEMLLNASSPTSLSMINPDMPAVLQFSGGTTGTPKLAICTHRNIVSNVTQFKHWLVNLNEGCETFLVALPLYHVYGMVLALNLGVSMGSRLVLIKDYRNIEEVLFKAQKYKVSYFPGVPSMFHMINQHPGVNEGHYDLKMIKACISGSAPLPENVRHSFEKFTGGHLVEGYGLSEAPTATHCNPILGQKITSSIGLPLPDVECRLISMDGQELDVPMGNPGELLVKGPQVMPGYYEDPEETEIVLNKGWLHTGDIVRMDERGYFFILGRLKDLIKVHGLQVWPAEVEERILQIADVRECAVAGVPDEISGERVKAWIVPVGSAKLTLDDLREFCRDKLVGYKIPSELEICLSIPKSPVGKVLRRELIRMHMEQNQ